VIFDGVEKPIRLGGKHHRPIEIQDPSSIRKIFETLEMPKCRFSSYA
jgi:hypothetical protein